MTGGPERAPGVLRGLADVGFTTMVTPRLVGCLYVAAAGVIACGSLVGLLLVWSVAGWAGGGFWWLAPLVVAAGVAGVLAARIGCEWVLMAFTRGRAIEPHPRPVQPEQAAQQRRPVPPVSRSRPPFPPPAARPMNSPQQWPGGSGDE
ncbi:DUF4282 domain-containing protein [Actinomadura chokoriensis]|uniref:DUF4282 domain-containing protein n=1 Tax=Actinomadura chokoriensis TaxID=454156 RepID=A0ABV4R528_9ACTN